MSWSQGGFEEIAAFLSARAGFTFPPARIAFAEAAIRRSMTRLRSRDSSEYLTRLQSDREVMNALLAEVTVGETYFFRDREQFELIQNTILPQLCQERTAPVRIWSAGCATGEELFSLAILLDDFAMAAGATLVGTDISTAAIERARTGTYGAWSFRDGHRGYLDRYFQREGGRWVVERRLRSLVTFEAGNLVDPACASMHAKWDLILCRNVLMYFDERSAAAVATLLAASLDIGGWLLTSPSDPILRDLSDVTVETTPAGLAYRKVAHANSMLEQFYVVPKPVPYEPRLRKERKRSPVRTKPKPMPVPTPAPEVLDPDMHLREAMLFLDTDRPQEAVTAARRAIFLDRDTAFGHVLLGRALRLSGKCRQARRVLDRARDLALTDDVNAALLAELVLLDKVAL
ncbi:MAG: CheR family methyltransferase [Vulcanimicrobiaceae bacterium]